MSPSLLVTPNPCPLIPAFKLPDFLHLYTKILFYYTEKFLTFPHKSICESKKRYIGKADAFLWTLHASPHF